MRFVNDMTQHVSVQNVRPSKLLVTHLKCEKNITIIQNDRLLLVIDYILKTVDDVTNVQSNS